MHKWIIALMWLGVGASTLFAQDTVTTDIPQNPTYYAHVKPLLEAHCLACHSDGGIASDISFDTLDDAQGSASDIAFNVSIGYMPPWMPSRLSLPIKHDRSLTDAEIATLVAWSDEGAPEGNPADYVPPERVVAPVDVRADEVLTLSEPYTPDENALDDYRCFAFPLTFEDGAPRYLTGYEFIPDVPEMAHHVVIYKVEAIASGGIKRKDGADGRQGWSCYGGTGLAVDGEMIGTWAPGGSPIAYPEGTGYRMNDGEFIIVQMHYNLAIKRVPSRPSITLQLADANSILRELMTIQLIAPVEIPCPSGITGEACDRDFALQRLGQLYGQGSRNFPDGLLRNCDQTLMDYADNTGENATAYCDNTAPFALTIYGAFGHMHELGKSFQLVVNPDGDNPVMMLDIPDWHFHWQDRYQFVEPFQIQRGDVVRMTCQWDNTLSNDPRYVVWGEGTTDEMCFGTLMASVPR